MSTDILTSTSNGSEKYTINTISCMIHNKIDSLLSVVTAKSLCNSFLQFFNRVKISITMYLRAESSSTSAKQMDQAMTADY